MTKVGMLVFVESMSWVIFCRQALPVLQMCTGARVSVDEGEAGGQRTFVGYGEDGLDIVVDLARRGLAEGEVALAYIAGARSRNERLGQRLLAHMLVVCPAVNVDYIARAIIHRLRLCAATSQHWSPAQRGGC